MWCCFLGGSGGGSGGGAAVHPASRPRDAAQGIGRPRRVKVRMTAREFAELVSQARDGSIDDDDGGGDRIARLVMEGCREGRWVAVDCVADEAERCGRRTALKATAALGPIAEE